MCDYSLEQNQHRDAAINDVLVTSGFHNTITRGFASADNPGVAVCLRPGTELAFESEITVAGFLGFYPHKTGHTTAIFRKINEEQPHAHHDALEMPDGKFMLLTHLLAGLKAKVIQMPATDRKEVAQALKAVLEPAE